MSQPTSRPDVPIRFDLSKICEICYKKIEVMCFKGTGVCGEICRKIRDKEPLDRPQAISNQ